MRSFTIISLLAVASLCELNVSAPAAQQLTIDQVPRAVQRTIDAEAGHGPIKKIEALDQNGRTIYKVSFQQSNGLEKEVYLEANGTFVNSQNAVANKRTSQASVPFADLPQAVQRSIDSETGHGPIKRIERVSQNGRNIYEVAFQQPTGREKVVYLEENGTFVRDVPITRRGETLNQFSRVRVPLSNARKVTFGDLPPVVQSTLRTEAGSAPIEDIDKGTLEGRTVYEAAFKQNEKTVELRVAEDGSIINDPQDRAILSKGPLDEAYAVTLAELPESVQNVIRKQAGAVPVERLQKGTLNGKTVYQAEYQRNGQLVRIRIGEDGSVVERPVAAVSAPSNTP